MIEAHIHVDCAVKSNDAAASMPVGMVSSEEEEEECDNATMIIFIRTANGQISSCKEEQQT